MGGKKRGRGVPKKGQKNRLPPQLVIRDTNVREIYSLNGTSRAGTLGRGKKEKPRREER